MMEKKVPTAKKYQHVKSTIQTGKTVNDVEVISDKLVAKRKGESFRRIKASTLQKLVNVSD
jgi:hypothetical protein